MKAGILIVVFCAAVIISSLVINKDVSDEAADMAFGEGVSHPLYRYLYLHLLFYTLQQSLRFTLDAE